MLSGAIPNFASACFCLSVKMRGWGAEGSGAGIDEGFSISMVFAVTTVALVVLATGTVAVFREK